LIVLAFLLFLSFSQPFQQTKQIPLSQVISDINQSKIDKVVVDGNTLNVTYKDNGGTVQAQKEEGASFYEELKNAGVDPSKTNIEIKSQAFSQIWVTLLTTFLPIVILGVFFYFIFRQAREAGSSVFSFGQSRAKMFTKNQQRITFADVAGVDEAKRELEEVVEFLKTPQKFKLLGARTPKGVLLVGPAGTGKTLLAKAIAGEAGVPFYSMAGSEFMEMLVGVGASRVRDLFSTAKKTAPSIIFIDEIESIGRMRGFGMSGGHDEREQTLNQILVEMDGFTPNDNVIVLGATNRPDLLDSALIRPGRFDRRVVLDLPDIDGRKAILQIHMKGKPFEEGVNIERLARRTVGFSGADLANMLNEAAILAAREGKKAIDDKDLEEAATKVKLGPQRKRMQSETERKMTAYHESGHAIVGNFLPNMDPVHRISIVARGVTGGHTLFPPQIDRMNETRTHLVEMIATALGGRAAEMLIFHDTTTGASSDLDHANKIARLMVTDFGMSDLGPINLSQSSGANGWPIDFEQTSYSQELAAKVDREVEKIIKEGHLRAMELLTKNKEKLILVSNALLEKETLDGDEFEQLVGKKKEAEK
jgi:cell division protease FtsH